MPKISSGVFFVSPCLERIVQVWQIYDHVGGDCLSRCLLNIKCSWSWTFLKPRPHQSEWYHNLTHCKRPSLGVFGVSGPVSLMGSVTMTEDLLLWWEILATPRSIFRNSASSCSIVNFCIAYTSHRIAGWQQRQEKLQGIMNENLEYSFPIFQSFAFQTCQSLPSGPMNR